MKLVERLHRNVLMKKTDHWKQLTRKSFNIFSNFPDMSLCFNSKMKPSCHTSSNALVISRNTPQTPSSISRNLDNSWFTDRNWLIHETSSLNLDCLVIKGRFYRKSCTYYCITDAEMFYCRSEKMKSGNNF